MKRRQIDLPGVLLWLIENFIFVVAAVVLFFKTAEILTIFAPQHVLGYDNAQTFYGYMCALLVEGLLVMAKYTLSNSRDDLAWAYNVLLILLTFTMSAVAQVVDGVFVRDELLKQPQEVQTLINVGIPLIPSLVLGLALGKTVAETMPTSITDAFKRKARGQVIVSKPQPAQLPENAPPLQQLAADVMSVRLRDMTPEDKAAINTLSTKQVRAIYGLKWREAIDLKHRAKEGKL